VRLKVWRWVQLENLPGLELHRLDLTDAGALERLFEKHARARRAAPFDAVINLAARAGVRYSVEKSTGLCRVERGRGAERAGDVPQVRREENSSWPRPPASMAANTPLLIARR